ncbi:trypsin-like serine peptidase [Kitasatospora sp. NPDC006697]|uniref:trypsin-like serine peptidase n=1 Tax=Kitasatospora sp. NPDC006697 TaxID=3364020 RepID=UPI0036C2D885
MKTPLSGLLAVTLLGTAGVLSAANPASAAAPTGAAPAAQVRAAASFAGTVALDDCSGSVIRMPGSQPADPALVLTNGHCLETGMPSPGEVITNQASSRTFTLLSASGGRLATLRATKVVYSTMTDTDVTIYQLNTTYQSIQQRYGISALTLSTNHPAAGTAINVVSGYWKTVYSCSIDGFVPELKEADWTWKDSVRYTSSCNTIGGTSGSPVLDAASGLVVAVNNTGNENGETCTLDNPCEVDANGNITVHQGTNYAEETYGIPACFGPGTRLNLALAGCTLPKP